MRHCRSKRQWVFQLAPCGQMASAGMRMPRCSSSAASLRRVRDTEHQHVRFSGCLAEVRGLNGDLTIDRLRKWERIGNGIYRFWLDRRGGRIQDHLRHPDRQVRRGIGPATIAGDHRATLLSVGLAVTDKLLVIANLYAAERRGDEGQQDDRYGDQAQCLHITSGTVSPCPVHSRQLPPLS